MEDLREVYTFHNEKQVAMSIVDVLFSERGRAGGTGVGPTQRGRIRKETRQTEILGGGPE